MKILSVVTSVPSENAMWWRILNIIRILKSEGHQVDLVCFSKANNYTKNSKIIDTNNISVISSPYVYDFIKYLRNINFSQYDLVYGNTHYGTLISLILKKVADTPLIFDVHGGLVEESQLDNQNILLQNFKKLVDKLDFSFSDKNICVSKTMIDYLNKEKKIRKDKLHYVTNGVDLNFFKPKDSNNIDNIKTKLGIQDKFIFGYIGGFQSCQGIENFLGAANKFEDENIVFLLAGASNGFKEKNIIQLPFLPRDQVLNLYSTCDVLVLPRPNCLATQIAAPTKFSEYSAMGKPVLTTNVGDASNFVREYKSGMVIEDNSINNLIIAMEKFKNLGDTKLDKMGKRSRKLAESEFDWQKIKTNLLKSIS
ncbi:glycosyltransferase family 4 protein [Methanobacterium aggregans]|uniref:glycosyltransferase family 4 protein n=1 Tax=Methanobacterium aggregans TaxID=1615586 RepID=UPI001AE6D01F|nr:glycosyltransferase family 4 protein [Methanobacterium aggregans]MBP2047057.1 glycosyltransferase involved in cell wall biosynthesis [Methanobacterium aggregans]